MKVNLKEGEVVPIASDRMFKAILMDSKEYLADILSNILDIDKNYILDNLVFKNTGYTRCIRKKKGNRFNSRYK